MGIEEALGPKEEIKKVLEALGIKKKEDPEGVAEEGPTIVLPSNPEIKKKLGRKLEEYRKRVEKHVEENPTMHPALIYGSSLGYKMIILERLLQEGVVDTWQLSLELEKKYGIVYNDQFNNAAAVIEDYCTTGGKKVYGGTGF